MARPPRTYARSVPRPDTRVRRAACAALAVAAVVLLGGCAKMDAALSQQWFDVQFNPNTTMTTARQVSQACAHLPQVHLESVTPDGANKRLVDSARFNVTHASAADMARLQVCLQRFRSVANFTLNDPGGY
jgi:hypothetical protein